MAKSTSSIPATASQERHGVAAGLKDQVGGLMDSAIALRRGPH